MSRLYLVIALVFTACGNDQGIPTPAADANVSSPLDVFRENCARCHGADGAGTVEGPQILNPVEAYATYVVRNGRGIEMGFADEMPAHDRTMISDADLGAIMDFLAAAPKPVDGEGLYVRFCANCHGKDARGGRSSKELLGEADEVHETVREGHGGHRYSDRTEYMPAWTASSLTNAEVAAIEAYLASLGGGDDDEDGDTDEDSDEGDD